MVSIAELISTTMLGSTGLPKGALHGHRVLAGHLPGFELSHDFFPRPGDRIWLSGQVGGSLLGRHMTFEPRVELALQISRDLQPHAMIDVSDGVALDLGRLLEASSCGAVVEAVALDAAIHADALRLAQQDGRPAREHALQDGEDFELIVVLSPDVPPQACQRLGLLPLGQIVAELGLMLDDAGCRAPIPVRGWEHFR